MRREVDARDKPGHDAQGVSTKPKPSLRAIAAVQGALEPLRPYQRVDEIDGEQGGDREPDHRFEHKRLLYSRSQA